MKVNYCFWKLVIILSFLSLLSGLIVVNDPVTNKNNYTLTDWLLTSKPGLFGLVGGVANPTGVALIIILLVMIICSQSFVRRGGSFEVFTSWSVYDTHIFSFLNFVNFHVSSCILVKYVKIFFKFNGNTDEFNCFQQKHLFFTSASHLPTFYVFSTFCTPLLYNIFELRLINDNSLSKMGFKFYTTFYLSEYNGFGY